MKEIKNYATGKAYILANNKTAREVLQGALDDFMNDRDESGNFIFIAYHVKDSITLLHMKKIGYAISFDEAIELVKQDILNGDVCANDVELKKQLNDPHATTAGFIWKYLISV